MKKIPNPWNMKDLLNYLIYVCFVKFDRFFSKDSSKERQERVVGIFLFKFRQGFRYET